MPSLDRLHLLSLQRAAVVAAVRGCVGTRFRAQGRTPGLALDCVGVALVAARAAGIGAPAVPPYTLGGDHEVMAEALLTGFGCRAIPVAAARPADLVLATPSRRHRHLAVVTPAGVVHAHAGLGRVVEAPLAADWLVIGAWQLPGVD